MSRLVLRVPGAKGFSQTAPERVQAVVGHLQDAPDVRRLVTVQKELGSRRVPVDAVFSLEHAQGNERIHEVVSRSFVKTQASLDSRKVFGVLG